MRELLRRPVHELARLVASGEVSAEELTRASLETISREDAEIGAFLTVCEEQALQAARDVDERKKRGDTLGPLAGVPVAVKDALATHDAPTTAASKILVRDGSGDRGAPARAGYRPPYDATTVARLRAADAIIVGKTNMDEFAMGSSTENSAFFPTRNPRDRGRIPGGSSGGSAAAVAAGMAPLALGSDTGGSIRQPASMTGVVGVKPTYGRVSRYGLFAFASSLDQVGVFANDVRSAAAGLDAIAGPDDRDSTCSPLPAASVDPALHAEGALRRGDGSPLRIGVVRETTGDAIASGVRREVSAAIDRLAKAGAEVTEVSLPSARFAVATYYVIATAEASSNLARYDGVRYGARVHDGAEPLLALYTKTRGRGFGREVKRRLILGTFVLSSGYYDAYYGRAQRVREMIRAEHDAAFSEVDVLVSPTSPTVAFEMGEKVEDPLAMYLADICTLPASLAGVPALSLPCGLAEPEQGGPSLPVGLQLTAPAFAEARLFAVAHRLEALLADGRASSP